MTIHVAIVEDEKEIRESLKDAIDSVPDFFCAGAFEDAESLIKNFKHMDVHVVLMDINLPGMSGIDCVEQLKEKRPEVQFLMCTSLFDNDKIYDALCAGATGYLLKNISEADVAKAIRQIHEGGSPMSPAVARKIVNSYTDRQKNTKLLSVLTDREKEVLNLIDKGYTTKIIADKLCIGIPAVYFHIRNIYEKLHVHSRVDAIKKLHNKSLA